jgi:hypothetical protein
MTDTLHDLLHDEAQRIEVPPAPLGAIVRDGSRRRTVRRARAAVAVAAAVAVVVGAGVVGARDLLSDDAGRTVPAPAGPTSASTPPARNLALAVSGAGVGAEPFGADADQVRAAVTERLGAPDLALGPEQYSHVAGTGRWVRDGADPMSPGWRYRVTSVSCWGGFCVIFGGDDAASLRFRGWELSTHNRWAPSGGAETASPIGVRLAGSGVGLEDGWEKLHAAYPHTTGGGGEGASLVVKDTPWPGISDGVGAWRLSGAWDYQHPSHVPANAVVTRLSAGEGPEPGCC